MSLEYVRLVCGCEAEICLGDDGKICGGKIVNECQAHSLNMGGGKKEKCQ